MNLVKVGNQGNLSHSVVNQAPRSGPAPTPVSGSSLPQELWVLIFSLADSPQTLLEARQVSKTLKAAADSNAAWRRFSPPPPFAASAGKETGAIGESPSIYADWQKWMMSLPVSRRDLVLKAYDPTPSHTAPLLESEAGDLNVAWAAIEQDPKSVGLQISWAPPRQVDAMAKALFIKAIKACPREAIGTIHLFDQEPEVWQAALARDGWLFDFMPKELREEAQPGKPLNYLAETALANIRKKSALQNMMGLSESSDILRDDERFAGEVLSRLPDCLFLVSERLQTLWQRTALTPIQ